MPFERTWDASCPRVWDRWQADGTTWVIQDLAPEDDEEAVDIMMNHLCPDELLCTLSDILGDPESVKGISEVWLNFLKLRTSLACYAESGGERKLVALNACIVKNKGDNDKIEIRGKNSQNLIKVVEYLDGEVDCLEYMGLDRGLTALGLVVRREYRGAKLGARLLAAREPLCRHLGIKGTFTIFTGPASQKSATRCGFTSIFEVPIKKLAEIGLNYPKDDDRLLKYMVKKYE